MRFTEAVPKFLSWLNFSRREGTIVNYKIHLIQLGLYMRNCDIEQTTLEDIMGYLEHMRAFGYESQGYRVKCTAFRKFFEFFRKQNMINWDHLLIPNVQREYKFPTVATHQEYEKVLKVIPINNDPRHIRNKALLMLYRDTGCRVSELLSLKINEIDLHTMTAVIKTKKSKNLTPIRQIFWNKDTNEQLKLWMNKLEHLKKVMYKCDSEALFVSTHGANGGRVFGVQGVNCSMRIYSKMAGLPRHLNIHSLRHLFGMDLAAKNVSDGNIATMLGHSTVESSRPYTILNSTRMREVYDKNMRKR